MAAHETFAGVPELKLLKAKGGGAATTTVLLGARLGIVSTDTGDGWLKVRAFGKEGWVRVEDTRSDCATKFFFVDVGQGDAVLVETPTKRFIVDGGKGQNFAKYLRSYKYKWLLKAGGTIHLDAIFVSHFDTDHFAGLITLIDDSRFTIGTVFHNGIARFKETNAQRPAEYDTDLGQTSNDASGHRATLLTTFSTLNQAVGLRDKGGPGQGGMMATFEKFVTACETAHQQGRLKALKRLTHASGELNGFGDLKVEVLGPVPQAGHQNRFDWFEDSSHTRNGHSVVLKITAGSRSILLGGDLNVQAENHLLATVGPGPFRVDVAKACHHGSSEFTTTFLKAVSPMMTVISSGDNQNYGHPQPDTLGAIGKHSRGSRPPVFSTELARSTTASRIHYGLINVRTDGTQVVGAQMFESRRAGDMWNSFLV
ncbi:MAG: ComEC/Rec2 family competence protein [Acidimicrobiales bacterium]